METNVTKDGFVLYGSHWPAIDVLSTADKGKLLEMVFKYHLNEVIPPIENPTLKAIFCLVKHQMDNDKEKYVNKVLKNKEIAKARWKAYYANAYDGERAYANDTDKEKEKEKDKEKGKEKGKEKEKDKDKDKNKDLYNYINYYIKSFNKLRQSKFRMPEKVTRQFNARIDEGYTVEDMLAALRNAMQEDYHIANGFKFLTPEFFTRADKIELYLSANGNGQTGAAGNGVKLGYGEWMEGGKRFYGTREKPYPVPPDVAPRPGLNYFYDGEKGAWIQGC